MSNFEDRPADSEANVGNTNGHSEANVGNINGHSEANVGNTNGHSKRGEHNMQNGAGGHTVDIGNPVGRASFKKKTAYVTLLQKIVAEMISTYILVFAGCGAAMVDVKSKGAVTHVGVAASFGLVVMIMVYAVGHISGAHMNPAVTLAFATVRHFPWKEVPMYWGAQIVAGICSAFSLRLIFEDVANVGATLPTGTLSQSFFVEIILTFILMFVISSVATDTRAIGELAGIAIGSAVGLDALFAGPISGASMNPARSIGPAIAANNFRGLWIYIVAPSLGAVMGAWAYHMIRGSAPTPAELEPIRRSKSFGRN